MKKTANLSEPVIMPQRALVSFSSVARFNCAHADEDSGGRPNSAP